MAAVPSRSFQPASDAESTISVLQFNTLADALADAFPHVSDKELVLEWQHREARLHHVLTEHACDFICAEEVDHFEDSFMPLLDGRGYGGAFAVRRPEEHSKTSRDGVALFWKNDKYTLLNESKLRSSTKCFGIVAQFVSRDADATRVTVAVVHLTAKPGREAERQQEVAILLAAIGHEKGPVVVGGDFNDVPESAACQQMRSAGFFSAYEHDEESWTTWKKREREVKRVIDYIWFRGPLDCAAVLSMPPSEQFPRMLPDEHYPSDHLAIAARLPLAEK